VGAVEPERAQAPLWQDKPVQQLEELVQGSPFARQRQRPELLQ
jgi:hypothetical protein